MTIWKLAMLALLGFLVSQKVIGGHWPTRKLRVWAAMFGASIAAYFLGKIQVEWDALFLAYICIDVVAGAIVLARPAGVAQKAIGVCFFVMVLAHVGLVFASLGGRVDTAVYDSLQRALGWSQLAILACWSGKDVGKAILHRVWPSGPPVVTETNGGADK